MPASVRSLSTDQNWNSRCPFNKIDAPDHTGSCLSHFRPTRVWDSGSTTTSSSTRKPLIVHMLVDRRQQERHKDAQRAADARRTFDSEKESILHDTTWMRMNGDRRVAKHPAGNGGVIRCQAAPYHHSSKGRSSLTDCFTVPDARELRCSQEFRRTPMGPVGALHVQIGFLVGDDRFRSRVKP